MSIKSQKCLYEECSEIIERSYSVKTASDDSLSCSDDEDYLVVELLRRLTPPVLGRLRRRFRAGGKPSDLDRRVDAVMRAAAAEEGIEFAAAVPPGAAAGAGGAALGDRWIDEAGLVAALADIFGHHKYSSHAHSLFQLLDPFQSGRAAWSRLIDRMVQRGARHTRSRREEWEEAKVTRIKKLPHCKRETIVKLVSVQHEGTFCFVAVSRGGSTGVYSGDLRLLASYQVFSHRSGNRGRVKNCWITDAVYMSDVQVMAYAGSERSLALYDARTPTHTVRHILLRLPALPTCLAYTPSDFSGESELAFGTERGDIYRLRFLQPRVSLLYGNATENTQNYVWTELRTPTNACYIRVLSERGVSARTVRRLQYVRDGEYLMSCSHDDAASVTVRPLRVPVSSYINRAPRGVSSFHCVGSLPLLAASSAERVLLWRAPPPAPPAELRARGKLADVAVNCQLRVVLALTVDCTLYIWDLDEEVLLQTLKLKFPFLGVLGKKLEFGAYSIHPGPAVRQTPSAASSQCSSGASSPAPGGSSPVPVEPDRQHWSNRRLQDDPEFERFAPPSLVVSCCEYVCVVRLRGGAHGPSLPPPAHALPARAPAAWGRDWVLPSPRPRRHSQPSSPPPVSPPPPHSPDSLPAPAHAPLSATVAPAQGSTEPVDTELDSLLKKAGLERILEKDFVLMQGLKHDLNKKLAAMRETMTTQLLYARAPHLSLSLASPLSLNLAPNVAAQAAASAELAARHRRVASLFPGNSVSVTPAASERHTPRNTSS